MIRNIVVLVTVLVAVSAAQAQTAGKKHEPGEVEITFANGSVVRMTLLPDDIEIKTEFGKLTVPVKMIRRIEFGLHYPEGMEKKVEAAVKKLASVQYKDREGAVGELVALGAYAYPAVLRASKGGDPETTKRAQEVLARIRTKVSAKELQLGEDDKVVTPRFTIVGQITTPAIKAKSEYFGDVEHALAKLRHVRVIVEARETEVNVDAAKYAVANQWLDTGLTVDTTSTLSIVAAGEVELRPSLPGTYISGPRGYTRLAGAAFGGGGGFGGKKKVADGPARSYPGTLLGRIGPNGDAFIIGDRFEGNPERDGKLYLQIVSSPYDTSAVGSYQVRISTRD